MSKLIQDEQTTKKSITPTDIRLLRSRKYKPVLYISNWFITGKHEFTLFQLKFFLAIAYLIQKHGNSKNTIRILASDLASILDFNKNSYKQIKDACRVMLASLIEVVDKGDVENGVSEPRWKLLTMFSEAEYDKGYVTLCFRPEAESFFQDITKDYSSLYMPSIVCQQAYYSLRLYLTFNMRLGKQNAVTVIFTVEQIRERFCLNTDDYKEYGHLKSKVLLPAQRDLKNTTEICFEMEEVKEGKKVTSIRFKVTKNKSQVSLPCFWNDNAAEHSSVSPNIKHQKIPSITQFEQYLVNDSAIKKGSLRLVTIEGVRVHIDSDGTFKDDQNTALDKEQKKKFLAIAYRQYLSNQKSFEEVK